MTNQNVAGIASQNTAFYVKIEQMEKMDKNLRPHHFSGNPLGTPRFLRKLSFIGLINFPTSRPTLHLSTKFILQLLETRTHNANLPSGSTLSQQGWMKAFSPTQISHNIRKSKIKFLAYFEAHILLQKWHFLLLSYIVQEGQCSWACFIRTLISFMKALCSWPDHFPKGPTF
jgi:hypothetical protein